jgi:hypothetical protein
MYVTANDRVHPYAGVVAEGYVAQNLGGGIDVGGGWNDRCDAVEWAEHVFQCREAVWTGEDRRPNNHLVTTR